MILIEEVMMTWPLNNTMVTCSSVYIFDKSDDLGLITWRCFEFFRFDFTNANLNNPDLEKVKAEKLPDVVSSL